MNSTDPKNNLSMISKVFSEQLLPLAAQIKANKKDFFEKHGDPSRKTYYVQREQRTVNRDSFAPIGCETEGELSSALAKLWESQGYPELILLAQSFATLAVACRSDEEQSEEVSPFIYVMF